jgi:hypothetical protein
MDIMMAFALFMIEMAGWLVLADFLGWLFERY